MVDRKLGYVLTGLTLELLSIACSPVVSAEKKVSQNTPVVLFSDLIQKRDYSFKEASRSTDSSKIQVRTDTRSDRYKGLLEVSATCGQPESASDSANVLTVETNTSDCFKRLGSTPYTPQRPSRERLVSYTTVREIGDYFLSIITDSATERERVLGEIIKICQRPKSASHNGNALLVHYAVPGCPDKIFQPTLR